MYCKVPSIVPYYSYFGFGDIDQVQTVYMSVPKGTLHPIVEKMPFQIIGYDICPHMNGYPNMDGNTINHTV